MKHTPGPWTARQRAGKPFVTSGKCTKGESIALIQSDKMQDAVLISSAPLLLEALKKLVARCDGEEGIQPDGSNMCTIEAHAAIKRAGGA